MSAERARARVTEVGNRGTGQRAKGRVRLSQELGAGRGPRGKGGKGEVGPRGQEGRGVGASGDGQGEGRGKGSGAPPQVDVQPVRCIPPGIQQMAAHHAHHHHHHHQAHLYNIDPDAGDLVPHQTPRPPYQPAPHMHSGAPHGPAPAAREPRAEPARTAPPMAAQGSGAAPGPQAQEPQAEPARGAEGARGDLAQDWTRFRTPWGARSSPWWWRCTGG